MAGYVTIKIPQTLAQQIDKTIQQNPLGYTSRSELVKEAVRTYLTNLKTA